MSVSAQAVGDLGEHALISRITTRLLAPSWVVVGPGDDAAVIETARGMLDVLTTDAVVDGVHVDTRLMPADAVGVRALAVNLSDLAAMGARPRGALLSLALPADLEVAALDGIVGGLLQVAAEHRVAILGGNVTRTTGPLQMHVTALGAVGRRRILRRHGARPGDDVYVTGAVGGAAAGLEMLRGSPAPGWKAPARRFSASERRYLYPQARLLAGVQLSLNRAASSCVDLSDGLADGVRQLAQASGVGMVIDGRALPIDTDVRAWHESRGRDPIEAAMSGGDDYELLFTARPSQARRLRGVSTRLGELPITRIGRVTRTDELLLVDAHGSRALPVGYEHFR